MIVTVLAIAIAIALFRRTTYPWTVLSPTKYRIPPIFRDFLSNTVTGVIVKETMGNLFGKALRKISRKFRKRKVRILLLGLDASGKTTILSQMKLGEATSTVPTIGFNVEEVTYENLIFDVWDVGGQDRLRPLWRHYYRGASGILFVVDSADAQRYAIAKQELHSLMREVELQDACVCILANKQDLPGAITAQELGLALHIESIPAACTVFPCTAKTGEGVPQGLEWLAEHMKAL